MIDYGMDFAAEVSATSWLAEDDNVYDHVNELGTPKARSYNPDGPVIIFVIVCL